MGQMVVFGFGGALGVTFVSAVIAWVTSGGAAGMEGCDDDDDGGCGGGGDGGGGGGGGFGWQVD